MTVKKGHSKDEQAERRFVAPDGGWGWVIVFAAGFSNFCVFAVCLCFGLIFRERFEQLGISTAETSTILNVNSAVTSFTGLANGPLFRIYSHRQISLAGALISTISICALSYAETFSAILILFSIMYGAGVGLAMSAGALALNTYFEKKRRVAVGFAWTITAVGPMISPQIIAFLMPIYGASGTCLLFGGFMFNAVACALLLQPVGMHARLESEFEAIEVSALKSIEDSSNIGLVEKNNEANDPERRILNPGNELTEKPIPEKLPWRRKLFSGIIAFFDLGLLRDPVYVNLMLGVSLSNFAEFNFMFLSPYIFSAYHLTDSQVATAMSVIAGVDLVARVMIPFVASRVGFQNKTYYLIGAAVTAVGRLVIGLVETYRVIMTVSVLMGVGRALIIIFQALVIPTHLPLERQPAGCGIQMMTGGLMFMTLGPIVGWIRDAYGDYTSVLHFMNFLSVLTIVSWTLQAWCCSKKR